MAESWNNSDTIAAINAANQALSSAAPAIGTRRQMKRAFKYQKQAMEMQNEMWRQNTEWLTEMNSPTNQLARYKEAGINPNFVYGNVSAAATSGEKPTATAPDISPQQKVFAQAMSGIRDIVPMFQAAVKAQQDLQRGEIAKAQDMEQLKRMELDNKYQDEYLRTRNQNAAFDYLWKTGTAEDRSLLIRYNREMAKERLDDAMIASKEHAEDREYWLTTGRNLDEQMKRAGILGAGMRYKLASKQYELMEKYGVKSIGDLGFGGLLWNVLDQSGLLPDLINWLTGSVSDAADSVPDITDVTGNKRTRSPLKKLFYNQGVAGYNYTNPVNNGGYEAGFNIFGF